MTTTNLLIILLMIAIFGGFIGYFIGMGVARAEIFNEYYIVDKPEEEDLEDET